MSTNGKTIEVRTAEIRTASVEIKTLSVSKRQVTLSLFRQLKNEHLLDPETGGRRPGEPWGLVNYFWGGCGKELMRDLENDYQSPAGGAHLHVVWQDGGELKRSCVWPDRWGVSRDQERRAIDRQAWRMQRLMSLVLCRRAEAGYRIPPEPGGPTVGKYSSLGNAMGDSNAPVPVDIGGKVWKYRKSQIHRMVLSLLEGATCDIEHVRRRLLKDFGADHMGLQLEQAEEQFLLEHKRRAEMVANYNAIDAEWEEGFEKLAALDQLFIAV